jgi:hypothetical protein
MTCHLRETVCDKRSWQGVDIRLFYTPAHTQVIHQQTEIQMYIFHDWGVILQCTKHNL